MISEQFFFNGKKMTRDEFVISHGMQDSSIEEQNQIIKKLIKRNKLKEVKTETPESKIFGKVQGDLMLDAKINMIQLDNAEQKRFDRAASESQQIIHQEVEVDAGSRGYADKISAYAYGLGVASAISQDEQGFYMVTMYDVSEKALSKIRMYMSAQKVNRHLLNAAEKTASAVSTASKIAAQSIISPGGKAAIIATAKTVEEATRVTLELGSVAVNKSVEGYQSLKDELLTNEDFLKAGRSFKNGFFSAIGTMKRRSGSGGGIRIK